LAALLAITATAWPFVLIVKAVALLVIFYGA